MTLPDTRGTATVWGDESVAVHDVLEWVSRRMVRPTDPKTTARPLSELAAAAGPTITRDGIGAHAALEVFDRVLAPATRAQDDPMNLAYIPSAPTRAAVAFDALTSASMIFGGLWETGAGAIFAEGEALGWLRDLLGWPSTAGGTFVSGGTLGNLSALHAARSQALRRRGRRPRGDWALACSAGAHSSIRLAARVMDVDVVEVPDDDEGRLTGAALRAVLERNPRVFAVVASAGTTNAGVIDELAEIADACAQHQVWMHVDGAYGGAGLAAPGLRGLFEGIEQADSFIVDPHKWLFAPYDCCALLYRDADTARAAHVQSASYLDVIDREVLNPSDFAIQLSRRARGLPFWFSLAMHGTQRYGQAVAATVETAQQVAAAIRASDQLRLVHTPQLSVLLFERIGWSEQDYRTWSRRMALSGAILCLPTSWRGRTVLRLAFVNPATRAQDVIAVLDTTREQPLAPARQQD